MLQVFVNVLYSLLYESYYTPHTRRWIKYRPLEIGILAEYYIKVLKKMDLVYTIIQELRNRGVKVALRGNIILLYSLTNEELYICRRSSNIIRDSKSLGKYRENNILSL